MIPVQGRPVAVIVCNYAEQVQKVHYGINHIRFHTGDRPTGFKTVLEGVPLLSLLLHDPSLILVVVAVI